MGEHQRTARVGNGSGTVYDYPEHLNPFYADENHKRLRFLNHRPAAYKSHRRGSLSSLVEWWQNSPLRFGKKRSSTLGINKTSESPPPLRRDQYDVDTRSVSAGTSGYRNTVTAPTYGTTRESVSSTTTPMFERQTRYRSTMQPRPQDNRENEFIRNNPYRSTIQNGYATYNNGMVTSTPRKKRAPPQPYGTTPRVPLQLNNSNPFDDETVQDGDNMSTYSLDDSYGSTLRSRTSLRSTRTKRRAPPPPPVNVAPANRVVPTTELDENQSEDLRNLTAEIASFVSFTTADESNRTETVERPDANKEINVAQTQDLNNNNAGSVIPTTVSTIEGEIVREDRIEASVTEKPIEESVQVVTEVQVIESNKVPEQESKPETADPVPVETVNTVEETAPTRTSPTPIPRSKSEKHRTDTLTTVAQKADIDFENLALPEPPVPTRRSSRERYITEQTPPASRSIATRVDPKPPATIADGQENNDDDEGPTTTIIVDNLHYKLKVSPIHTEINTKIENARLKISESTGNLPSSSATDTGTAGRRRSVKDIIDSINKSQSMLKVNHEQSSVGLHETQSTDSMRRDVSELNQCEKEIENLIQDIEALRGDVLAEPPPGRRSYYDNLTDDNLNDNLDDVNNMDTASGRRVKKSPTKTVIIGEGDDQQFQDCINWNPLPKPRRTHILVENVAGGEHSRSNDS